MLMNQNTIQIGEDLTITSIITTNLSLANSKGITFIIIGDRNHEPTMLSRPSMIIERPFNQFNYRNRIFLFLFDYDFFNGFVYALNVYPLFCKACRKFVISSSTCCLSIILIDLVVIVRRSSIL